MIKEILRPIILGPLILLLLLFVLLAKNFSHESAGSVSPATNGPNPLSVSQNGSSTTTNFSGADLQQAAPPALSTTTTDLSPQQASPYQEGL